MNSKRRCKVDLSPRTRISPKRVAFFNDGALTDSGRTESPNEIEYPEFDVASDLLLATFLIKSFWRLHISMAVIDEILGELSDESAQIRYHHPPDCRISLLISSS